MNYLVFDLDDTITIGPAGVSFMEFARDRGHLSNDTYELYSDAYHLSLKGDDYYSFDDDVRVKEQIFQELEKSGPGARGVAADFVRVKGAGLINPVVMKLVLDEMKAHEAVLVVASASPDYLLDAFYPLFPETSLMVGSPARSPGFGQGKLRNVRSAGVPLDEIILTGSDSANDLPLLQLGIDFGRAWMFTREHTDTRLMKWGAARSSAGDPIFVVDHNTGLVSRP